MRYSRPSRTLFWFSQPAGTPITDDQEPWYLVGADVDTCAIKSHAFLGNGTFVIPFALEFYGGAAGTPMFRR